jgi:hypothetical protein
MYASSGNGFEDILAIRVETKSGTTQLLLARSDASPQWVLIEDVEGIKYRLRS